MEYPTQDTCLQCLHKKDCTHVHEGRKGGSFSFAHVFRICMLDFLD